MRIRRWLQQWCELCSIFFDWMHILWHIMRGAWKMTRLPQPRVTFFGGARVMQDSQHAKGAHELARRLAATGVSIVTGGGPGIMEAANCGAYEAVKGSGRIASMGIGVDHLPGEQKINACAQEFIVLHHFFARKWLLINYSIGFVIFPGGFGTLDEFSEVITLIQTKKLKQVPIILFNTEYWKLLIQWIHETAIAHGMIPQEDADLVVVTDDFDEIFCLLRDQCDAYRAKKNSQKPT